MEKITLFFCIFPGIYDFFNLMAVSHFFQSKICINTSRLIESRKQLFLGIIRFVLEKPFSRAASEKGMTTLSNLQMVGKAGDSSAANKGFSVNQWFWGRVLRASKSCRGHAKNMGSKRDLEGVGAKPSKTEVLLCIAMTWTTQKELAETVK